MMADFLWVMASQKLLLKAHHCGSGGALFTRIESNFESLFTASVWYSAVIKELKQASMPKELIDKRFHD